MIIITEPGGQHCMLESKFSNINITTYISNPKHRSTLLLIMFVGDNTQREEPFFVIYLLQCSSLIFICRRPWLCRKQRLPKNSRNLGFLPTGPSRDNDPGTPPGVLPPDLCSEVLINYLNVHSVYSVSEYKKKDIGLS